MKIIHYCLGLPPYATGGLSIYANDLVNIQAKEHEVYVLFPGVNKNQIHLKKISYKNKKVKLYRLDGALPCALTYGVKEPLDFIGHKEKKEIEKTFLPFGKIDVLHLHTLQGLYPEIIKYFKENGTKIVYTTHDFYPFSLTTKYYNDKEKLDEVNLIQSLKAPSTKALYLNRKPLINKIKKIEFIKNIFNKKIKGEDTLNYSLEYKNEYLEKANKLYAFYSDMLKDIDLIHANSNLSKDVYLNSNDNIKVIGITHNNLELNNLKKNYNDKLIIGFFGEQLKDKGFTLLLEVLDEIYKYNKNFILNCYGKSNLYQRPYLSYRGTYSFNDLKAIYQNVDLVVFPAINIESFGFVVLESLAYQTPVIVSSNVGAKDLCNKDYIIDNEINLKKKIIEIIDNKNILKEYFNYDLNIDSFEKHNEKIIEELYK